MQRAAVGVTADATVLKAILSRFAAEITTAANSREAVSVLVTRRGGFQNELATARGLGLLVDEPVHFGGCGEAPDPAELLLGAVGASLSVTLTAHAALRDIPLHAVALRLSAAIDGIGFFSPGFGAPGLLDVAIELTVTSPASESLLRLLVDDALLAAPVLRSLNATPRITLILQGY